MKKINYNSYIGTKINRLTIESIYKKNGDVFFICKCECGNIKTIRAKHIIYGAIKSCGCLLIETSRKNARKIGLLSRKYEEKCNFCGKKEHYAKGYCRNCYNRYWRKSTVEYRELLHKHIIPLNKEQIEKGKEILYIGAPSLVKNNIIDYSYLSRYKNSNRQPRFTTFKKCFDFLGIDIFEELNIDEKYKDPKKYKIDY